MDPIIKRKKAIPYIENAWCPTCEVPLEKTDITLSSFPPLYVHSCPKCNECYNLNKIYPSIIWETVEE